MKDIKEKERPPVIAIMGHIDHGKSALLDYIRSTKVVESEAGGITQHLSAYEVKHKGKLITFLDTPGHEAFQKMRARGSNVADIAILIISAEEGPKTQTIEALQSITDAGIPYIVALTKIDKERANVEKVKNSLLEHEIYLEGLGGDVPYVAISSKTGEGIPDLLNMMLLVSEVEELKGDKEKYAEGIIIESHRDPKKGISATLIIKDGTLSSGSFVVSGNSYSPTRIMQNFLGDSIKEATFSSPVTLIGFNTIPDVGSAFTTVTSKKEAERLTATFKKEKQVVNKTVGDQHTIPIIVKADALGTLDAVLHEINKMKSDRVHSKIIHSGVGTITENDIKTAGGSDHAIVAGFNVSIDAPAEELARRTEIEVARFDIIYKLTEWLEEAIKKRTPRMEVKEVTGKMKVLKIFNKTKNKQVIGGRIETGSISVGDTFTIVRKEEAIANGTIEGLQQQKAQTNKVEEGEFGSEVTSPFDVAEGDILETFIIAIK